MPKKMVTIRAEEDDIEKWKEAAWLRRMTLSQWARILMTYSAEKEVQAHNESQLTKQP